MTELRIEPSLADDGLRRLMVRGVVGYGADLVDALRDGIEALRAQTARPALAQHGIDIGFRVEDALEIEVRYAAKNSDDAAELMRHLRRIFPASCSVRLTAAEHTTAARIELDARFVERDGTRRRAPYVRIDGRLHVEAFELHVVEHCNLRCAHCCNMSPYLDERFLSVEEIEAQCQRMASHLCVDVFKIMGGEPLLHPRITDVLRAIRRSRISPIVRLFTNGLLLHQQDDAFWAVLDQLTISNYSSAQVRPELLDRALAKARAFDVLVNVKPVDAFSQVMATCRHDSDAKVQATYDACWLRDRCLIVRDGQFFKCTRAAYFREFQTRIAVTDPAPDPAAVVRADGVALDDPAFDKKIFAYMNDTRPLGACQYCQGSSGALVPHTQLTRTQIRSGRL